MRGPSKFRESWIISRFFFFFFEGRVREVRDVHSEGSVANEVVVVLRMKIRVPEMLLYAKRCN